MEGGASGVNAVPPVIKEKKLEAAQILNHKIEADCVKDTQLSLASEKHAQFQVVLF